MDQFCDASHAWRRNEVTGTEDEDVQRDTADANGGFEVGREGGDHAEEAGEVEGGGVDEEEVDAEVREGGLRVGRTVSASKCEGNRRNEPEDRREGR